MKLPRILSISLYCVFGAVLTALSARYILPLILPAIVAFALARVCEPVVTMLDETLGFGRKSAAFVCSLLLITGIVLVVSAVFGRAFREFRALSRHVPDVVEMLTDALAALEYKAKIYANMSGVGHVLQPALDAAPEMLAKRFGAFSAAVLSRLSALAGYAPSFLLFTVTGALSLYFISAEYRQILSFIKAQIPQKRREEIYGLFASVTDAAGSFARAQFLVMCLTFGELLIAFTLLRVEYATALALILTILDALPVIGTGMALIPWSAVAALVGRVPLAVGLLATYLVTALVRNIVQAGLVGAQTGLHPLTALTAMYAGFRAFGVGGMVVLPIAAAIIKQLHDRGILSLWRTPNEQTRSDTDR